MDHTTLLILIIAILLVVGGRLVWTGTLVLGRVLINRRPNPDLDVPPNVRYWG
jgi:hypothetical protein